MNQSNQFKTVSIDQLVPGMYVVAVLKQKGRVEIKTEGWVRTDAIIAQLKKKGVLELLTDPSKDLNQSKETTELPASEPVSAAAGTKRSRVVPYSKELEQAQVLYQQAKGLQKKAFADIQAGRPLALQPFVDCANGVIESVFRNQDALLCISRIRDKDAYLLEHSVNVSILMTIFAKQLGFEQELIQQLATGALLHDMGKIKVPDHILNKPGRLDPEELQEMRNHVIYSFELLESIAGLSQASLDVAAVHHERLDGKGYPLGLKDQQISQYGRMIAIVDTYDAITATRCYKEGQSGITALKIMKKESHSYDQELLAQFIQAIGIHPVGTLVKLKSQRLAIVLKANLVDPLKPVVKVFYHTKFRHYLEVQELDLAQAKVDDEIEAAVMPEDFDIDLMRFFRQSVLQ
ncbi:HD-GYP domain-containing protein [Rheinheimera sp.]|uniref:HD-GYP domain-containing protein n=1 Tax=Rheinheimera sp. TaxID=1869214 RepID=UPI00307ECC8C